MKKTMLSLAAASLVMGTAAYADVNVDLGGQAKVYYETNEGSYSVEKPDLFNKDASKFNAGIQLNGKADLGNSFGFGAEATFLGSWGLDNDIATQAGQSAGDTEDDITFTQLYLTKKSGNTTVKAGRQTVSKAISPFVYSEKWNIFQNTASGIVVSNTDITDTTIVAAYFGESNNAGGNLDTFNKLDAAMLTVQTKAIPMTTLTASYYHVDGTAAVAAVAADPINFIAATPAVDATDNKTVLWLDVTVAGNDLPAGLTLQAQYGNIDSDSESTTYKDTTAYGVQLKAKVENIGLRAAYTAVDDGNEAVANLATDNKSPLYTQMIANQGIIKGGAGVDVNTWLIGATADFGDMGKLIVNYSSSNTDTAVETDKTELDVIYKIKSGGVQYFAAYVNNDYDVTAAPTVSSDNDKVRFWASYAF